MTALILVAYATKHGSTKDVAEAIMTRLREHGLEVDIQPAGEVRKLDGYSAVVLGAPLYMGRWHGDALSFLKRHRAALSGLPVAIFALGPLKTAEQDEQGWRSSREQLDHALVKVSWLAPVAVEMFGGVIDPTKLHFPFSHMPAGNAREGTAIRSWADKLAATFQPATPETPEALPRP